MKIGIVGIGWVGSSIAISTLHSGVASELLVSDIRSEVAEGEAMDLSHGSAFYPRRARIRSVGVEQMASCDAVIITAGRGSHADESRLSLLRDNAAIVGGIAAQLRGLRGILIVVTNPVDVMTRVAAEASGMPPAKVIGTGTMLDTARLRFALGEELDIEPRSIHAQIIGEHGDSEVVLWSGARVGGIPLRDWHGWSHERERVLGERVRRAAYEIIRRKGATNHAIGLVTAALLRWCLRGERRVLTVARVQEGAFGLREVALSLPCVVSGDGAVEVLEPEMEDSERDAFLRSAEILRVAHSGLDASLRRSFPGAPPG
ncbi:MAG: L-lactate dehydrogenase [Polyangiaceae bacterium]|nr:L-lactate dehydrogenase [Polyangiaceae bacterium]